MALRSNGWSVKIGEVDGREIDFVCEKKGETIYIQVVYITETPETLQRELASLEMVRDNWSKYLITTDTYEENEKINGIILKNIKDFIRDIEKGLIH
jgi:predicted AAA+ superfamily ATPase